MKSFIHFFLYNTKPISCILYKDFVPNYMLLTTRNVQLHFILIFSL